MSHKKDGIQRIKKDGWRQGSVLSPTHVENLLTKKFLPWNIKDDDLLIVLSHNCDVTKDDLDLEPYVELLLLRSSSLEDKDGNVHWGKNPRRYQFKDVQSNKPVLFNISVHDRVLVPRDHLIGFLPDQSRALNPENISRLTRWITNRYNRASFPDAFNDRVNKVLSRLRKVLKAKCDLITGIYILGVDDELPPEEDYSIILFNTMLDDVYKDPAKRESAQEITNQLEAIFGECEGISLTEIELRSESEISLHDLHKLKRWDFDDLSLRKGSVSNLPLEQ